MLEDIHNSYLKKASRIEGWDKLDKNYLANKVVENEGDPDLYDSYFAALVCKYWYNIGKFIKQNQGSDIPVEECYNWLIDGLHRAVTDKWGKRWLDKKSKLYGDPNGPDKAINRCLMSIRAGAYQDSNRDKRRANYLTESLDSFCEEWGDYFEYDVRMHNSVGTLDFYETYESLDMCRDIINKKLENKDLLGALILDEICYQDCFKDGSLNERKVVSHLNNLNSSYLEYFGKTYQIDMKELKKEAKRIAAISNPSLYRNISRTLNSIKDDKRIVKALCC